MTRRDLCVIAITLLSGCNDISSRTLEDSGLGSTKEETAKPVSS